jgi:hypothetical protein
MLLILLLLSLAPGLVAGSFVLLEGDTLDLDVGRFRGVNFTLQEYESDGAELAGSLCISPDTATVELLLMHQDDFSRWAAGLPPVDTLAFARVGSGPFRIEIPRFGWLVLVMSNRGNISPVSIGYDMHVTFRGPRSPGDPLPSALKLLLLMMTGAVVIAVAGGVIAKELSVRRRS